MIDFFFYFFSLFITLFSLLAACAKNDVRRVMSLVASFVCASGLFIVLKLELLAMLLLVVYGGAIAILFLFVVMMIDEGDEINIVQCSDIHKCLGFSAISFFALSIASLLYRSSDIIEANPGNMGISEIGIALYEDCDLELIMGGIILLVVMIGAILIAPRRIPESKKSIPINTRNSLRLVDIKSRGGAEI